MDKAQYEAMIRAEEGHWWFRGRRKVIARFLKPLSLGKNSKVLEIGCGGGGNLTLLSSRGNQLRAIEPNEILREHASQRGICEVRDGRLPAGIPFEGEKFDLICLFDVLEHVQDDSAAVAAIGSRLSDGGRILVTVPASPSLWSRHDVENQHFRRYTKAGLRKVFSDNGFTAVRISFFNALLFPAIWIFRKFEGKGQGETDKPELDTPSFGLSGLFYGMMNFESFLLSFMNFSFGVSLVCIVGKTPQKA
jgi:SAM-dependent methyltransferase